MKIIDLSGAEQEFRAWATKLAERFGYTVEFRAVGPEHADLGSPTQMGIFSL